MFNVCDGLKKTLISEGLYKKVYIYFSNVETSIFHDTSQRILSTIFTTCQLNGELMQELQKRS